MVDGDPVDIPVTLADALYEFVPEDVTEVDKVAETVDDGEKQLDPVGDVERVLHGDAVNETDAVPHGLADIDGESVVDTVVLEVPHGAPVAVDTYDVVTLGEVVNVADIVDDEEVDTDPHCDAELDTHDETVWELVWVGETVDDVEIVPDTDCETELVPHEDAQWEPDAVPL